LTKEAPMVLPAILNPFVEGAPAAVMTRIALDWIIEGTPFDQLFDAVAEGQYTREFTLAHFVQVMLDVASGHRPTPRAAFLRRRLDAVASISAFYRKLSRMELALPAEVVRQTARRARDLIVAAEGLRPEPVPGYAVRILDGNILTGVEHRITPLRATRSAGLPGMALAIYEPASGLIRDVVLEEDAHCQERALLDQVVIGPGELWIVDRNFCVRTFLFRIALQRAFYLARWHKTTFPFRPVGPRRARGRCATGAVFEQAIEVDDPDRQGGCSRLRRIVLELDEPTRDGETEIVLVTNLPAAVTALVCCEAYRGRWRIEGHFQTLTDLLHCEVPTLGYPRAALFAFSMSVVAGNALAVLKGNLRAAHGDEVAGEVSDFALVDEVAEIYPGMMLAAPPEQWSFVRGCSVREVAGVLTTLAATVPVERMFRCRRGPKRPRTTRRSSGKRIHHVSNKKLLDQARGIRPPKDRCRTHSAIRS
jgi:hypothetical protein